MRVWMSGNDEGNYFICRIYEKIFDVILSDIFIGEECVDKFTAPILIKLIVEMGSAKWVFIN